VSTDKTIHGFAKMAKFSCWPYWTSVLATVSIIQILQICSTQKIAFNPYAAKGYVSFLNTKKKSPRRVGKCPELHGEVNKEARLS